MDPAQSKPVSNSSAIVPMIETTIDPTIPKRLEKNANMVFPKRMELQNDNQGMNDADKFVMVVVILFSFV